MRRAQCADLVEPPGRRAAQAARRSVRRQPGAVRARVLMKIITREIPPRAAWALEQAGIHPLLARLFAARGVLGKEELDDALARLLAPAGLKGVQEAAVL